MIVAIVGTLVVGAIFSQAYQSAAYQSAAVNLFSSKKRKRKQRRSRGRMKRKRQRGVVASALAEETGGSIDASSSVFSDRNGNLSNLFDEVEWNVSDISSLSKESKNPSLHHEPECENVEACLDSIPQYSRASDSFWKNGTLPDHPAFVLIPDDIAVPIYVMPRPTNGPQTYIAKELLSLHGVIDMNLLPCMLEKHGDRAIHFLALKQNHVFPEVTVWNIEEDGLPFPDQKEIELYLVKNSQKDNGQVTRQLDPDNLKLNLGFYSSLNIPNRDANGISIPELKAGSTDVIPTSLFCVASNFLAEKNPYFTTPMSPERSFFSQQIHANCSVEALTIARSRSTAFHRDRMNPAEHENSFVLSQNFPSFVSKNQWVSIICYQRKSISDYLVRTATYLPLVNFIKDAVSQFPAQRQCTALLFDYLKDDTTAIARSTTPLAVVPCLDPLGYYNIGLVCVVTLVQEMHLSFAELIGLVNGVFLLSKTLEPCLRTTLKWLNGTRPRNMYGFGIGFQFLLEMNAFYKHNRTCKPRYSNSRPLVFPTYGDFEAQSRHLFHFCLATTAKYNMRPSNKSIPAVYEQLHKSLVGKYDGIGRMIGVHCLSFLSYLGLIPSWIRTFAHYDPTDRVYSMFATRFKLGTKKQDATQFMSVVSTSLGINVGRVENVLCKVVQERWVPGSIPRKSCHSDVHFWKAPFIVANGDELFLMMKKNSNSRVALFDSVLIPSWFVNGDEIGMPTIATNNVDNNSTCLPQFATAKMEESPLPYEIPVWWKK